MPILLLTLILAVVLALTTRRPIALGVTAAASVISMVTFVWAVADDKGDDPWWLILVAGAVCALALGLCAALSGARARRLTAAA
jgi:peptidoglycan/LPS O-acetylase OafA/YrhL